MTPTIVFLSAIALSIGVSAAIIYLLRPVLEELLTDLCGTARRAAFWARFSHIMLVLSPLLTTTLLTKPEAETESLVLLFRAALFNTLLGAFIALGVVGLLLWKAIPFSAAKPVTNEEKAS